MPRKRIGLHTLLILLLLIFSATVAAQNPAKKQGDGNPTVAIWRGADSVGSLNLLYGAGGQAQAPDPNGTFTFAEEDLDGTSPKFDVEDAQGVRWKVKLGKEAQSEVAATRLLWAAGYFVDVNYYLPKFKVIGLPKLRRGGKFVSADGTVHGARLERKPKGVEKLGNWDWFRNPFLDKRELNGLRIMMALLNNSDLKKSNNSIEERGGERRYFISDLGATFGKTGDSLTRSRSVLKDYANSKFIKKVTPEHVDFVMNTRPIFLLAFLPHYYSQARMQRITKRIPRADVQWLGQILAQLSTEQIRDSFRAAGYTPEEVEGYTQAVQKRITELNAPAPSVAGKQPPESTRTGLVAAARKPEKR